MRLNAQIKHLLFEQRNDIHISGCRQSRPSVQVTHKTDAYSTQAEVNFGPSKPHKCKHPRLLVPTQTPIWLLRVSKYENISSQQHKWKQNKANRKLSHSYQPFVMCQLRKYRKDDAQRVFRARLNREYLRKWNSVEELCVYNTTIFVSSTQLSVRKTMMYTKWRTEF